MRLLLCNVTRNHYPADEVLRKTEVRVQPFQLRQPRRLFLFMAMTSSFLPSLAPVLIFAWSVTMCYVIIVRSEMLG